MAPQTVEIARAVPTVLSPMTSTVFTARPSVAANDRSYPSLVSMPLDRQQPSVHPPAPLLVATAVTHTVHSTMLRSSPADDALSITESTGSSSNRPSANGASPLGLLMSNRGPPAPLHLTRPPPVPSSVFVGGTGGGPRISNSLPATLPTVTSVPTSSSTGVNPISVPPSTAAASHPPPPPPPAPLSASSPAVQAAPGAVPPVPVPGGAVAATGALPSHVGVGGGGAGETADVAATTTVAPPPPPVMVSVPGTAPTTQTVVAPRILCFNGEPQTVLVAPIKKPARPPKSTAVSTATSERSVAGRRPSRTPKKASSASTAPEAEITWRNRFDLQPSPSAGALLHHTHPLVTLATTSSTSWDARGQRRPRPVAGGTGQEDRWRGVHWKHVDVHRYISRQYFGLPPPLEE